MVQGTNDIYENNLVNMIEIKLFSIFSSNLAPMLPLMTCCFLCILIKCGTDVSYNEWINSMGQRSRSLTNVGYALCCLVKFFLLTNFVFKAAPDVKIVSNLPSISMEEVAPVTHGDGTLLAPEEVKVFFLFTLFTCTSMATCSSLSVGTSCHLCAFYINSHSTYMYLYLVVLISITFECRPVVV